MSRLFVLFCVWLCMSQSMHGGQRPFCSQLSPTMWIPGDTTQLSAFVALPLHPTPANPPGQVFLVFHIYYSLFFFIMTGWIMD